MKNLGLVAFLFLAVPALHGQGGSLVTPAAYANQGGRGTSLVVPFDSRFKAQTLQQVCDDMQTRSGTIKGFSLRRMSSGTGQNAWSVTLSAVLSTAPTNSLTISPTFALNQGPDRTDSLSGAKFSFPPVSTQPGKPQPWIYHFPFTKPFPFAGKGPLCLELRVLDQLMNDPWIYLDTVNLEDSFRTGGTSYQVPGQNYPAYCGSYLHYDSQSFRLEAYGGALPKGEQAIWMVGWDIRNFAGLPLPFALAGLGFPNQSLYVAPVFLIGPAQVGALSTPHQVNFTGAMSLRFPNLPGLTHTRLYSQIFCTYAQASYGQPLLFTTYSWNEVPPAPLGVSCVTDTAGGPGATIGQLHKQAGFILRFNL